ncbi:ATP-binding protein [Paucibacter sp. PLA-PC-4]|uniref:ATP-binding protein n=1 Tax=Paucibacter sp. PLA-PC-4 TaxID=2993655 RepID=UPI00224B2789|nr:ATP-binding protein [Paucibacter sp. PLA-PC-4]MCX2865707.1 ATP-binding protein [Paucibacter sp. PLA-PC-4]
MKASSLSRQIVLSMTMVAFCVTLLVMGGSFAFYYALAHFQPASLNQDEWTLTTPEVIWMLSAALVTTTAAAWVALRLARRILLPLNSVADCIQRVAAGDLSARASESNHAMGEATRLVHDVNSMAGQLERSTREKALWNAAIAHELRTPVTVLRGRLQGLADGVFEPSPELFGKLLSQVEGLSRLIEDLRTLGLSENGQLHLQIVPTDLAEEVRKVVDLFEPAMRAAGHKPELDLHPGRGHCDPVRFRQVLLALLENVRKHAVPGIVRIHAAVANGRCVLRVEDEGPGVPGDAALRMFEAFWRADASRSRDGGGSGLGLAVVSAITRAHNGHSVCVPSPLGGTAIELTWPDVSNRPG